MNLGKYEANSARDFLASDIAKWQGGILVVDGELSDELPHYSQLNNAIVGCLSRAAANGLVSQRIFACDNMTPNWPKVIQKTLLAFKLPTDTRIELTGAWYHEDDSAGCVNATYNAVRAMGYRADVRDSAVRFEDMEDEEEDDDFLDDEDDDLPKSSF